MKRAAIAAILLLACGGRPAAPPAPKAAAAATPPNLLELVRGAAVVSRTGEATLEASAVRAIDGDTWTAWVSPPNDGRQTLVFALPSQSRIDRVGLVTGTNALVAAKHVRFALSADGVNFTDAGTFAPTTAGGPQLFRVTPAAASYVRVETLDDASTVQITTVWASGQPLQPVATRSLDGCWSVNGSPAVFSQTGSRVTGYIAGHEMTAIDGGFDGRLFRFAWTRGPEYGLAAVTLTPDNRHLSGVVWHEEALRLPQFAAPDWVGEAAPCSGVSNARGSVFRGFVERVHYMPLYGLRFDEAGRLIENESAATLDEVTSFLAANPQRTIRFLAHHLVKATPQENRDVAQQKADTLREALRKRGAPLSRVEFVVLGAEHPRRDADVDLTRAMYSSVELELAR